MSDEEDVVRTVKLLTMRQDASGNVFKQLAIERKIKLMPDRIMSLAEGRFAKLSKKKVKATKPSSPQAKLVSATLTAGVRESEPTIKGHIMQFEMNVDLPKKAKGALFKAGEGEFARNLYGVYFEWWEEIINEYDFSLPPVDADDEDAVEERDKTIAAKKAAGEGGWEKPWSDIYLSNPQSQTFGGWKSALDNAAKGTLDSGNQVMVQDAPGVNIGDNGFKRRILRFRINAGDATGEVFKADAIQVLEVEDGILTSSYYYDSTGAEFKRGAGKAETMRYRSKVGVEVKRTEGSDFVVALETDKAGCSPFVNDELETVTAFATQRNLDLGRVHKDVNQSNRMNVLPLIPSSDEYWSKPSSDGGLLVGQLSGGKVKRLYHTDNVARQISVTASNVPGTFDVRTFEQLPLD